MGRMKDIVYYPGFLTYKQQQILQVFDDDFISAELIARRCRLSKNLVSTHLRVLKAAHIVTALPYRQLFKWYLMPDTEREHIKNAMEEIALKRDKLQKKLQKYFHMSVYSNQLFYCLTPYGLKLKYCIVPKYTFRNGNIVSMAFNI